MDKNEGRRRAVLLAQEHRERGDFMSWFESLYASADGDVNAIPWADLMPNPKFANWVAQHDLSGAGKTGVVVGCGLGDDAELLASRGFNATAFDISPTAIEWCKKRFPRSSVQYEAADLFALPGEWAFDFVLEAYTVQALPLEFRERAIRAVANLVARGGTLLAIGRLVGDLDERTRMPWPLTRSELDGFTRSGLRQGHFEDYMDGEDPPVRRFCAEYRR
ncbi:MAG: class I SAM-dependent methyltransferase [Anaerolineae bacterium]|nr:class I SAM-dependent methyltransferase [Anaerolineae bacterium]